MAGRHNLLSNLHGAGSVDLGAIINMGDIFCPTIANEPDGDHGSNFLSFANDKFYKAEPGGQASVIRYWRKS